MSAFGERIRSGPAILLDGGLGSELIARGLPRGAPPDLWTLTHGHVVEAVHRAYVAAGAEAVHTNTFGASPVRLAAFGLDERCDAILRRAVALARAASPRFVIGDVGPTGEYLPPVGSGDPARWRPAFARQARVLAGAGVDALHVETMSDLREARLALEVLQAEGGGLPVLVSMTFERKKRGFFTIMGDPLVPSLQALLAGGAAAAGANCNLTSRDMTVLMREALSAGVGPLVAQPNAGAPEVLPDGTTRYAQPPDEFADDLAALAAEGVRLAGGCCGTDPRFVAALRARMEPS